MKYPDNSNKLLTQRLRDLDKITLNNINRELISISKSKTNLDYGCYPEKRPIKEYIEMGVVNIDKSKGPSSHEVTAWIKNILHIKKAGHSGSLDPKVTGLLPIMLGKATRLVAAIRLAHKEYVCLMRLHGNVSKKEVLRVCKEFTGQIFQTPPIKSAVKRQVRIRTIYYIDVIEVKSPFVLMRVGCEAGTYIRKLCHDIGLVLGCGGHMQELRRTKVGPFNEGTLSSLHDLTDAYHFWKENGDESHLRKIIMPMEHGLSHIPKIIIRDSAVDAICSGAKLAVPGIVSVEENINKDDLVCIMTQKNEAVSLSKALMSTNQIIDATQGYSAITERVIMNANTYPRIWKTKQI